MAKDYLVGIIFLKKNNIYKNLLTLATEAFLEIFLAKERASRVVAASRIALSFAKRNF